MRLTSRPPFRVVLLFAGLIAAASSAQTTPIRLVVGFPQGGGVDLVARQFAPRLAQELGEPVEVVNIVGEAGNKASAEVARGAADGRTLLIVNPANIAINPALYPNLGFDPKNDFAPVARMVVTPLIALIPASLSPQNVDEFITRIRTQKSLKYASGGVGNINHLAIELFKIRTSTRIQHQPAKNSSAALAELLEGRVQLMADGGHVAGKHVREGRLRALAVFGEKRLEALPDVPTAAEAGIQDLVVSSWLGIVVPAATPAPAVTKLQKAVGAALARPEVSSELVNQGTLPSYLAGADFRAFIESEQQRWAGVIKEAGIKLE